MSRLLGGVLLLLTLFGKSRWVGVGAAAAEASDRLLFLSFALFGGRVRRRTRPSQRRGVGAGGGGASHRSRGSSTSGARGMRGWAIGGVAGSSSRVGGGHDLICWIC